MTEIPDYKELLKKDGLSESDKKILQACIDAGSQHKAAKLLGFHRRTVERAVAAIKEGKKKKEEVTPVQEHQLKLTTKGLQKRNKELLADLVKAQNTIAVMSEIKTPKVKAKPFKRSKSQHTVIASAFLSDTHLDEVVSKAQTGGINAYNRSIAERRLEGFVNKCLTTSHDLLNFNIERLDVPLGGDMVSGNIHEELARTNQAEIMDTVNHWSEKIAEALISLSKEYPELYVPCVVGNHGRNTKKVRHKGRIQDNFDWLIYMTAQRIVLSSTKNVKFDVSEHTDALWKAYDSTYCLTHGDQASGGGGWGGIASPIMRLNDKKSRTYASLNTPYRYLIMGHWHQFKDFGNILVNGSLKGYDEFAKNLNFEPEPPQQAFWITAPKKGKIMSMPLFVDE